MHWLESAACIGHDPDLFFPISEEGIGRVQAEIAKQVCHTCPVLAQCLAWATASAIPYGVWGGLSESQRRDLAVSTRARARVPTNRARRPRPAVACGQSKRS